MSAVEKLPSPSARLHEVTMAAMARRPAEPESSVTISRNAKGVAQFEVTVRGGDPHECYFKAEQIYLTLGEQFPYPASTNGGTE